MTIEFVKNQIKEYESQISETAKRVDELNVVILDCIDKSCKLDKGSSEYRAAQDLYENTCREKNDVISKHYSFMNIVNSLKAIQRDLESVSELYYA